MAAPSSAVSTVSSAATAITAPPIAAKPCKELDAMGKPLLEKILFYENLFYRAESEINKQADAGKLHKLFDFIKAKCITPKMTEAETKGTWPELIRKTLCIYTPLPATERERIELIKRHSGIFERYINVLDSYKPNAYGKFEEDVPLTFSHIVSSIMSIASDHVTGGRNSDEWNSSYHDENLVFYFTTAKSVILKIDKTSKQEDTFSRVYRVFEIVNKRHFILTTTTNHPKAKGLMDRELLQSSVQNNPTTLITTGDREKKLIGYLTSLDSKRNLFAYLAKYSDLSSADRIAICKKLSTGFNDIANHHTKLGLAHPLVHGNICPQNISFNENDTIRFCNWGDSVVLDPTSNAFFKATGTLGYFHPNDTKELVATFASGDLTAHYQVHQVRNRYSFAAVLFFVLVGRPPYDESSFKDAVGAHKMNHADLETKGYSPLLINLIMMMIDPDYKKRPNSWEECRKLWEAITEVTGVVAKKAAEVSTITSSAASTSDNSKAQG